MWLLHWIWYLFGALIVSRINVSASCTEISDEHGNLISGTPTHSGKKKVVQIWAATCDFEQCDILTSVDSDEPVQP